MRLAERGPLRKESSALKDICERYLEEAHLAGEDEPNDYARFEASSDAAKLLKFVVFHIDGFTHVREDEAYDRINQLRMLMLYYVFSPFKSTASDYFKIIKKRAQQFYYELPTNYAHAIGLPAGVNLAAPYQRESWFWKIWLTRTPAAKDVQAQALLSTAIRKARHFAYNVDYRELRTYVMECDSQNLKRGEGKLDIFDTAIVVQ